MLVKFDSNVAGEMLMFADVARRLLTVAGKECTARGVITREQIPEIVVRLRQAATAQWAHRARVGYFYTQRVAIYYPVLAADSFAYRLNTKIFVA